MSPLRERMIEDMTLAGWLWGRDRPTPRRCDVWQRVKHGLRCRARSTNRRLIAP